MKLLGVCSIALFAISCTKSSIDGQITSGLSVSQKKAQELIQKEITHLHNSQYGISENDLALLKNEGLLDQDSMNSINIIK